MSRRYDKICQDMSRYDKICQNISTYDISTTDQGGFTTAYRTYFHNDLGSRQECYTNHRHMSFLVGVVRAFVLLPPCLLGIRVSTSACVRAAETRPMISGYPGALFTTGVPAVFADIMAAMYARGEDEVAATDSAGCAKHFVGRIKTMRLPVMTQGTLMEAPNESGKMTKMRILNQSVIKDQAHPLWIRDSRQQTARSTELFAPRGQHCSAT